jgi:hypothetical protein
MFLTLCCFCCYHVTTTSILVHCDIDLNNSGSNKAGIDDLGLVIGAIKRLQSSLPASTSGIISNTITSDSGEVAATRGGNGLLERLTINGHTGGSLLNYFCHCQLSFLFYVVCINSQSYSRNYYHHFIHHHCD